MDARLDSWQSERPTEEILATVTFDRVVSDQELAGIFKKSSLNVLGISMYANGEFGQTSLRERLPVQAAVRQARQETIKGFRNAINANKARAKALMAAEDDTPAGRNRGKSAQGIVQARKEMKATLQAALKDPIVFGVTVRGTVTDVAALINTDLVSKVEPAYYDSEGEMRLPIAVKPTVLRVNPPAAPTMSDEAAIQELDRIGDEPDN